MTEIDVVRLIDSGMAVTIAIVALFQMGKALTMSRQRNDKMMLMLVELVKRCCDEEEELNRG